MDMVDEAPHVAEETPEPGLAIGVTTALGRLIGLFRSLSPPDGLSLTAAATLTTLERSGPSRLTALAAYEGVTQPAMTQLVDRLQGMSLLERMPDPADGRVVQVRITGEGRAGLRSGSTGRPSPAPGRPARYRAGKSGTRPASPGILFSHCETEHR